jgi:uncharacterized membrane protein
MNIILSQKEVRMNINEAWVDRILRIVVGILFIVLGFFGIWAGFWKWFGLVVGVILLLTGASGICPLYTMLNFKTKKD